MPWVFADANVEAASGSAPKHIDVVGVWDTRDIKEQKLNRSVYDTICQIFLVAGVGFEPTTFGL